MSVPSALAEGTFARRLSPASANFSPTLVPDLVSAPPAAVSTFCRSGPISVPAAFPPGRDLPATNVELEHRAFELKAQTSQFASHLTSAWRAGLFGDLDRILDPEEWELADRLPSTASFLTFMRMVTYLDRVRRPGLGVTHSGTVVAMWADAKASLSIECLPDDQVRWVLSYEGTHGKRDRVAGVTNTRMLPEALKAFKVDYLIARQDP